MVFDSIPGDSRWLPVVFNILEQPGNEPVQHCLSWFAKVVHYCDMVLQQFIPDHKPGWNSPLDIDSERSTISHNGHHRITSDTVYQTSVSLFACQRVNSPECNYRDYRLICLLMQQPSKKLLHVYTLAWKSRRREWRYIWRWWCMHGSIWMRGRAHEGQYGFPWVACCGFEITSSISSGN